MQQKTILITGGSGLVGTKLTEILLNAGYEVRHLGRSKSKNSRVKTFVWDVDNGTIEAGALDHVHAIVNLAGASVADKKWTKETKQHLIDSRIKSTELLYKTIQQCNPLPKVMVSASGVGYFGRDTGDQWMTEEHQHGSDFLAQLCHDWELAADQVETLGVRVVKYRIGVVLAKNGGALKKMTPPIQYGIGAAFGSGWQYMSWIHIEDLCQMILFGIDQEQISGVYNAVSDDPTTNEEFTKTIAKVLHRPLWLPKVPSWLLKLFLGELSSIILGGNRVSNQKIKSAHFSFTYLNLYDSLRHILRQP